MSNKTWCIGFLLIVIVLLMFVGGLTAWVDPFFHYHAPLDMLNYQLDNQRYQNDGILKHFEYDAILTGTSETENFKSSEFDKLFGTKSVKVSYSGATFKEVYDSISEALKENAGIRYVLRSIDGSIILEDKDAMTYPESSYPRYLYDDVLFNDAPYLLNKEVFLTDTIITLRHTMLGYDTTSFDEYSNWMKGKKFGKEAVDLTYSRPEKKQENGGLDDEERRMIYDNLMQNVVSLVKENPHVDYYLFFPPYSIYWWDEVRQNGRLEKQIDIFEEATRILVEYDNVHLFSLFEEYDIICNLDNYKDIIHYHESVNSEILKIMAGGENCLTKENYQEHWSRVENYLNAYSFDLLFD